MTPSQRHGQTDVLQRTRDRLPPEAHPPTPPESRVSLSRGGMCYTTTPLHSCGHAGKHRFHGAPCPRATVSSFSGKARPCAHSTDYGSQNVSAACPRCGAHGRGGMSVRSMLGAVRTAVASATADEDGSEYSDDSEMGQSIASLESLEDYQDDAVPDLGFLGDMGDGSGGRLRRDAVSRGVARDFNSRFRAFARGLERESRGVCGDAVAGRLRCL